MTTKQIKLIKPEFQGSMGFEIECVFKSVNEIKVMDLCDKNSWQKGYDGSIRTTPEFSKESEIKFHYNLNELNEKLPEVQKLLELIKSGTKYGCGFHIHLSFEEICNYYKLASWKFVEYFQNEYTKYAKTEEEKARIQNSFCKFYDNKESYINNTNVQLNTRSKNNRYFAVNFNSFNLHNTIEFRIFTGTDKIQRFIDNINFLIKTINNFISEQKEISIGIIKDTPKKSKGKVIRKYVGEDLEKIEAEIFQEMRGETQ